LRTVSTGGGSLLAQAPRQTSSNAPASRTRLARAHRSFLAVIPFAIYRDAEPRLEAFRNGRSAVRYAPAVVATHDGDHRRWRLFRF
jgi:hypothetical protein